MLCLSNKDEEDDVRYAAAKVLGELGDARAIPALRQALSAKSKDVTDAAAIALKLIGSG
jgi:HEAT repeat protein